MPIVTVSRQFGSGGSEVASRVASLLDWTLLDNAVVESVAARLGIAVAEVEAREERLPSLVERLASALTLASPEVLPPPVDGGVAPEDERIVEVTSLVIDEAVQRGPCVIVGRGAQCRLADRADALHVLCHAPRSALARRVAAREQIGIAEAERLVDETNHRRAQYVRRHWHREWLASTNYHLSLDIDWLGVEVAAQLVAELARERLGDVAGR